MAKKKTGKNGQAEGGESIAGYFRRIFQENPKMLKDRSNDKLIERWVADHPGEDERLPSVRSSLANLKSVLRSKKRRRGKAAEERVATETGQPVKARVPARGLEELEIHIDESLMLARKLDAEGNGGCHQPATPGSESCRVEDGVSKSPADFHVWRLSSWGNDPLATHALPDLLGQLQP